MRQLVHSLDSLSRIETVSSGAYTLIELEPDKHYAYKFGAEKIQEKTPVAIRLYLSALTLVFLILAWMTDGVSVLEAIVVVCSISYLILDTRESLLLVKEDLKTLEQLEKKLSVLLS